MLNNVRIGKFIAKKLTTDKQTMDKLRKKKLRKKQKKRETKTQMTKLFGKFRYYASFWLGNWVLYAWNHRDYNEVKLYQKFYTDENIAKRYGRKLQEKYEKVWIEEVFDKKRRQIGYILHGKQKKVVDIIQQPPHNVISFAEYKLAKVK